MKVLKVKMFDFCFKRTRIKIKAPWDYWFILMTSPSQTNPKPELYIGPTF